jgi:DNA-binding transcriptional regulator PaaX
MGGLLFKHKKMTVNADGLRVFSYGKKEKPSRILKRNYSFNKCFYHNFANKTPKDLIVMYDIPANKRKERDWLRRHLQRFDYIMIQKSVWVGPSPLPREFLDYIKSIGLLSKLRTLKLAKPYSKGILNM